MAGYISGRLSEIHPQTAVVDVVKNKGIEIMNYVDLSSLLYHHFDINPLTVTSSSLEYLCARKTMSLDVMWHSDCMFTEAQCPCPNWSGFMLDTLVFRCLHGTAPAYLAESFNRAADDESRRRLRSGASPALLVPTTRRRTLGDRTFPVAGARVWNSLPATLTSQSSLLTFRQQLKTLLFEQSYP